MQSLNSHLPALLHTTISLEVQQVYLISQDDEAVQVASAVLIPKRSSLTPAE